MEQNKFLNGKIYSITSPSSLNCYIGSTIATINRRFIQHRSSYKFYLLDEYNYVSSFELIKFGDSLITLLEAYPCNSKLELHNREQWHILNTINCINKNNAINDPKDRNVKSICQCRGSYTWTNITKHNKTKKHLKHLADIAILVENQELMKIGTIET